MSSRSPDPPPMVPTPPRRPPIGPQLATLSPTSGRTEVRRRRRWQYAAGVVAVPAGPGPDAQDRANRRRIKLRILSDPLDRDGQEVVKVRPGSYPSQCANSAGPSVVDAGLAAPAAPSERTSASTAQRIADAPRHPTCAPRSRMATIVAWRVGAGEGEVACFGEQSRRVRSDRAAGLSATHDRSGRQSCNAYIADPPPCLSFSNVQRLEDLGAKLGTNRSRPCVTPRVWPVRETATTGHRQHAKLRECLSECRTDHRVCRSSRV